MQPFTANNSGARKTMFCIQLEHALPLIQPEIPFIQTGYENSFGDYPSSIKKADADYEVVDKIFKFQENPNHHYYLLLRNKETNQLHMIERVSYNHITETYGYLYNNSVLDQLDIGYEVQEDEVLARSCAFDEYGNRCDGVNLLTTYIAMEKTMEDGIIISESAQKKLGSPLLKKVSIIVNDNDIPLNLHGNDNYFKAFPEIGEEIEGGILCCLRRDNSDESLFTQSWDNLKKIMTSDDKITVEGKVIDINVFSNSPEILKERSTNEQLLKYYNEKRLFLYQFTQAVQKAKDRYGCTSMSYELSTFYNICMKEMDEKKYLRENKVYSGTLIEFIILEYNYPHIGDKLSNRYGGKGVIAGIYPDELMAKTETGETIDLYFNQATCVNRLNGGQLKEQSLSMISKRIMDYITLMQDKMYVDELLNMILTFIRIISPSQFNELNNMLSYMTDDEKEFFLDSIINDKAMYLSIMPLTESVSLDTLNMVYKEFPWIKQYEIYSPIKDSNGNYRLVKSMRNATCGYLYIYRLKQYAEEKFSVTNLSATNLRNENTRSKANKNYRSTHQNTPIRFGDMESGDFGHMGMEKFVTALLVYSLSPQARDEMEDLWTKDAYNIDIKLGPDCKNRSVEIINTYFKEIGFRIVFEKKFKEVRRLITFAGVREFEITGTPMITFCNKDEKIDPIKYVKGVDEYLEKKPPISFAPIRFGDDFKFKPIEVLNPYDKLDPNNPFNEEIE